MSWTARAMVGAGLMLPVATALASLPVIVNQAGRRFSVAQVNLHRGEIVRFVNADEFGHHVFVDSPLFHFDSGEQKPGQSVDVLFTASGQFDVRCEIHPKMLLKVSVE